MNLFSKYVDKELWLECILAIPANEREVLAGLSDYFTELLANNRDCQAALHYERNEIALEIVEWLCPNNPFELFTSLKVKRVGFFSRLLCLRPVITFTKRYSNEPLDRIPAFLWRDLNAKNIELGFRSWGDE